MMDGRTIRVFETVNQPFERVRAALMRDVRDIFSRATTVAHDRASHFVSALRVSIAGIEIGKEIDLQVLGSSDTEGPTGLPNATRIELQWTAVGRPALFPTMRAELAIYPGPDLGTRLDLSGIYKPPFGPLGAVLDVVVGHRVAEACVQQFVSDVAARLRADLA
jgi:hypothetical protein